MSQSDEFNYKKYLTLIRKKKYQFVVVALLIMTSVIVISYSLPNIYEARSTVFIEKSVINELVRGIAVTPSMDDKIRVLTVAMKSRNLLLKVFQDLDLNIDKKNDAHLEAMVKSFQERTDIRLKDHGELFMISFADKDPRLARDYVNTLVRRYIEDNLSSKREESYDATKFLSEQIATVKEKLDQAEARSNSFRQEKGSLIVHGPDRLQSEINDAQSRIDEIRIKRDQLETMRNLVKSSNPLQERLTILQKKLQDLNVVYTENYPSVIEVKNEIASVKEQLASNVDRDLSLTNQRELSRISMELKSLNDMEHVQKRVIAAKRSQMNNIPVLMESLEELEREKNSQKNLYEQLLARYRQSEVSKQMEVQDKTTTFRVVDPAVVPFKPVGPKRVKMMIFGILGGLVVSFALLLLLDHLDKSLKELEKLKSLGLPVLAVIPRIESENSLLMARRKDIRFFSLAAVYFSLVLGTLSFEYFRDYSGTLHAREQVKSHLSQLKDMMQKF
jgi:protein tyrosine kinase modulator